MEKLEFSLKKIGLELFENISIEFQAPKLDFRNLKLKIDSESIDAKIFLENI